MPVRYQLTRLSARRCEVQAINDVVEPPLEELQEGASGLSGHASSLAKVIFELSLVNAVVLAHLLLLAQLTAILGDLLTGFALRLLAGRRSAAFNCALFRETAVAFEEQLDFFTGLARRRLSAADAADGTCISCHLPLLHPSPFRRAATVVGNGCNVFNQRDL